MTILDKEKFERHKMKALEILKDTLEELEFESYQENNEAEIEYINEVIKELEELKNRSCDNCKHHLSDNGNYPLHPCCECSRFFIDSWEPKG